VHLAKLTGGAHCLGARGDENTLVGTEKLTVASGRERCKQIKRQAAFQNVAMSDQSCFPHVVVIIDESHEDYQGVASRFVKLPRQGHSVDFGHRDIENGKIRFQVANAAAGFFSVSRHFDNPIRRVEESAGDTGHLGIVIGKQDCWATINQPARSAFE
jgi:hypothetical protein